jgi:hypothetical protein
MSHLIAIVKVLDKSAMSSSGGYDVQHDRSSRHLRPAPALWPAIAALEAKMALQFILPHVPRYPRFINYTQQPFRFLDLPREVRDIVYEYAWAISYQHFSIRICLPSVDIRRIDDRGSRCIKKNALLFVNKQVSNEAARVVYFRSPLHMELAPFNSTKPYNLDFVFSNRTTWFTSTTRHIVISSAFTFGPRNAAWVKALQKFQALTSLEVLLSVGMWSSPAVLRDAVVNLLPFAALQCEEIVFRGLSDVEEVHRKETEEGWQVALLSQPDVVPVVRTQMSIQTLPVDLHQFTFIWDHVKPQYE